MTAVGGLCQTGDVDSEVLLTNRFGDDSLELLRKVGAIRNTSAYTSANSYDKNHLLFTVPTNNSFSFILLSEIGRSCGAPFDRQDTT
jgi:hypothetical protein